MRAPKKAKPKFADVELVPDAWPKFEQFIRDVTKAGPQHREAPKAKPKPRSAKRG